MNEVPFKQVAVAGATLKRASRIRNASVSHILRIGDAARRLIAKGRPVIVLAAGEPDFDTPDNIKDAACRAIRDGQTKYTALTGTPALKAAIIEKFRRENGLEFDVGEVAASAGAKQVLYNAFMATLDPGDEVIVVAPHWNGYTDIIDIAGGRAVVVKGREDDGFRLSPEDLEAAITPKTRWLLLNSPSNPGGAAYSPEALGTLLDVLLRHPHVWLMMDDIYEHILYDGRRFVTALELRPQLRDRTLTVNGVSKAYAMTGWRIGYAAGPAELIAAMAVIQSHSTTNPCSVSQAAAIEALTGPQDIVAERREIFQRRRDLVVERLNACDGIECRRPEGAFYVLPNCAGVIGKKTPDGSVITSDIDFCDYLLDAFDVAVVPGSYLGISPYFRISYAASDEALAEACARIARATGALR